MKMKSEKQFVLAVGGSLSVRGIRGYYTTKRGAWRAVDRLRAKLAREGQLHRVETYWVLPVEAIQHNPE